MKVSAAQWTQFKLYAQSDLNNSKEMWDKLIEAGMQVDENLKPHEGVDLAPYFFHGNTNQQKAKKIINSNISGKQIKKTNDELLRHLNSLQKRNRDFISPDQIKTACKNSGVNLLQFIKVAKKK